MLNEAFLAGFWSSLGSTIGKLTGVEYTGDSYVLWAVLLALMILVNTWGCRHYLRALDAANNSVAPTVVSAATSYVLSGLIGVLVFDEGASVRWWIGTMLIVMGLALIARPRKKQKSA